MSLADLPRELCRNIFEFLPGEICVIRKKYVDLVVRACKEYNAGDPRPVSRLPDYELRQWLEMRRHYRISRDLRDIAISVQVQQRWLSSSDDPTSPPVIPKAVVTNHSTAPDQAISQHSMPRQMASCQTKIHQMKHHELVTQVEFDRIGASRYHRNFCGFGASDYIVFDVTDSSTWVDDYQPIATIDYFGAAARNFVWCAQNKDLFKTVTNVDLIVAVPAWERSNMEMRVLGMIDCVTASGSCSRSRMEWFACFGTLNRVISCSFKSMDIILHSSATLSLKLNLLLQNPYPSRGTFEQHLLCQTK